VVGVRQNRERAHSWTHRLFLVLRPLRVTRTGLVARSGIRSVKCPHTLRGIKAAEAGRSSFEVL